MALAIGVASGQQPPPVFRAEAYVITNNLILLERNDKPIAGLTAADFAITVEKKPVALKVAEHADKPAHYLLSFNPPEELRDGKFHRIDVKFRSRDGTWKTLPMRWRAVFEKPR
jgi:hypothetical protein